MKILKPLWLILSIASMVLVFVGQLTGISAVKSSVYIGLGFLIATIVPIHFKKWAQYRRDFGIVAGILLVIHGIFAFQVYLHFSLLKLTYPKTLGGTLATFILVIMIITSNFALQRKLKGAWRTMHAYIWFAIPLALTHAIMAVMVFFNEIPWLAVLTLGGLIVFVFVKPILPSSNQKESLRDILLAVAGIALGLIIYFVSPTKLIRLQPKANISPQAVTTVPTVTTSGSVTQDVTQSPSAPKASGYTLADVAKHNAESGCYVVFQGNVYDVTSYLPMHPGGARKAARKCGQSLDDFDSMHSGGSFASSVIQAVLQPLSIGTVK